MTVIYLNNLQVVGPTYSGAVLDYAKVQCFTGGRLDHDNVIMMLTDGKSNDDISIYMPSVHNAVDGVLAMGIDAALESELQAMATDPTFWTKVQTFADLKSEVTSFLSKYCGKCRKWRLFSPIFGARDWSRPINCLRSRSAAWSRVVQC